MRIGYHCMLAEEKVKEKNRNISLKYHKEKGLTRDTLVGAEKIKTRKTKAEKLLQSSNQTSIFSTYYLRLLQY